MSAVSVTFICGVILEVLMYNKDVVTLLILLITMIVWLFELNDKKNMSFFSFLWGEGAGVFWGERAELVITFSIILIVL